MSKFKKKAAKLFKIDLEDSLEEQLKDYLKDSDVNFIEDPWDSSAAIKPDTFDTPHVSNGNEFYDSLMKLYIDDLEYLTRNIKPKRYYAISGSGPAWYLEPHSRTFVKTERGMQVLVVTEDEDDSGRLLVQTMNTLIMVPKEEILVLGYN